LLAAAKLLFNTGRLVVAAQMAEARRQQEASVAPALLQSLARNAHLQLMTLNFMLVHTAAVVGPFARTVGKPGMVLPWLSTLLEAFFLGTSGGGGASAAGVWAWLHWEDWLGMDMQPWRPNCQVFAQPSSGKLCLTPCV
jgi:hypothetical protein